MMRKTAWFCGALAVIALLVASPVLSHDGGKHGRHMMMDGEKINLSDLADGETRTFGEGEHLITATRHGDLISIAVGDQEVVHDFSCNAGQDNCFVIQSGDSDAMKLFVTKSGDDHHATADIMVMALGDGDLHGDHEFFFSDEDGEKMEVTIGAGGGHWVSEDGGDMRVLVTSGAEGVHPDHFRVHLSGTTLRCPEGDTTMHFKADDSDEGPYYCPKHDVRLEKVEKIKMHSRMIHVQADEED
jgi:hypothetical protein